MDIICLGDSLTFGYGISYRQKWTTLTAEQLGVKVINRGINGDTAAGMLTRLRTQILNQSATSFIESGTLLMIMGGSNDILYTGSDICAKDCMGAMIHQAVAAGFIPLIGIPIPIGNSGYPEAWEKIVDFHSAATIIQNYSDWLTEYCQAFTVPFIDFRPPFYDGFRVRDELYLDGLHPNAEGCVLIANRFSEYLKAGNLLR